MTQIRPTLRAPALLAVLSALVLLPACAQGGAKSEKSEIESIVKEYILANPEIIEDALIALTEKEAAAKREAGRQAIAQHRDRLYNNASDFSIGPADAKVTVVEFFDYRCGFCKRSVDFVRKLPEEYDGKVRVVFKELPIFGGISETAALAALAAGRQGKYMELHVALMDIENNNDLTEEAIDRLAAKVGVDVRKMRADMASDSVKQQLAEMQDLGMALAVGGTPGFFIGDAHIEGANTPEIEKAIAAALKG